MLTWPRKWNQRRYTRTYTNLCTLTQYTYAATIGRDDVPSGCGQCGSQGEAGPAQGECTRLLVYTYMNSTRARNHTRTQVVMDKVAELQRLCDETLAEKNRLQLERCVRVYVSIYVCIVMTCTCTCIYAVIRQRSG